MAPKVKLIYFALEGLGEPIRWMLEYGNIEYEDHRIKMEEWDAVKPTTPFGKVPILEIDGKQLTQSSAICRYLAHDLKLLGQTKEDAAQADIIVDTLKDFIDPLAQYFWDPNPETKAPKLAPLQNETVPFYISRFEKVVAENGGHFVNGQLTWADIFFFAISDYLELMAGGVDFYKDSPNLAALKKKVREIPQIKAWIEKRPPNIF